MGKDYKRALDSLGTGVTLQTMLKMHAKGAGVKRVLYFNKHQKIVFPKP